MLKKNHILETIKNYIVKESFSQSNDIHYDTLIFEDSLLDSMGFLFLIDFLKEEFKIEIEDNELVNKNFESINSISNFINDKLISSNVVKEEIV